ncbi:hypothetical protein HK096_000022 [Nowakowskiella sp. JEL0078]|nr:hypothetical protein HK096_000022 [Nowakowskiella sp. JEL0078]
MNGFGVLLDVLSIPQYVLKLVITSHHDKELMHDICTAFYRDLRINLDFDFMKRLELAILKCSEILIISEADLVGSGFHNPGFLFGHSNPNSTKVPKIYLKTQAIICINWVEITIFS